MMQVLSAIFAFTAIGYFDYPNGEYSGTFPQRANSYFVSKQNIPNMSTHYWDCGVAVLEAMMERRLFGEVCESNANVVASFYGGEYPNITDIPKGSFSGHKMFDTEWTVCFFGLDEPYDLGMGLLGRDYNFRDGPDVFDFEIPNLRVGRFVKPTNTFDLQELSKPGGKYGGVFWRLASEGGPYQLLASAAMTGQHETIVDAIPAFDEDMFAWGGPLPTCGTTNTLDHFGDFAWRELPDEDLPGNFYMSYWTWHNVEPGFTGVKFQRAGAKRPQIREADSFFMPQRWIYDSGILVSYLNTEEGGIFRSKFMNGISGRVITDGTVDPSIDPKWYFSSEVFGPNVATSAFDPNYLSMTQDRALWRPWAVLNKVVDATDRTYVYGLSYRPRFRNCWKRAAGTVTESKVVVAKNVKIGKYRSFNKGYTPDPIGLGNPMRFELTDIVRQGRITTSVDYDVYPSPDPDDVRLEYVARYGRTVDDFTVDFGDDAYCHSNYEYRVSVSAADRDMPWYDFGGTYWKGNTNDYSGLKYDVAVLGYRSFDTYPQPAGQHTVQLECRAVLREECRAAHPEVPPVEIYDTTIVQQSGDYIEIKMPLFPQMEFEEVTFDLPYSIKVDTTGWYPWYIARFYDPTAEQPRPNLYPVAKFCDGEYSARRVDEIHTNYLLAMRTASEVDPAKDPSAKSLRHAVAGLHVASGGPGNLIRPDSDCQELWEDELLAEWEDVPKMARTLFPLDAWEFFEGVDAENWRVFSEIIANVLVTYDYQRESYARWAIHPNDMMFTVTIDVEGEVVTKCEMEWADGHADPESPTGSRNARGWWFLYPKIDFTGYFRGDELKDAFQELADWSAVIDNVNMNATKWKFKTRIQD